MDDLRTLYDTLQKDGYDVPHDYERFSDKLAADRESRESLYEVLKKDNYDVPDNYGHFSMKLFGTDDAGKTPVREGVPVDSGGDQLDKGFGIASAGVPFVPVITFGKNKPEPLPGAKYKPSGNPLAFKPKAFSERNMELIP